MRGERVKEGELKVGGWGVYVVEGMWENGEDRRKM